MPIRFFIAYFGLATLCATLFSLLEIQIEGKNGWAGKLPTWRMKPRWLRYMPGAWYELTGYHTYLWLLLLSLVHLPYLFIPFSWGLELLILSFYGLMLGMEDFLWFALNPHYGLKKFKKKLELS